MYTERKARVYCPRTVINELSLARRNIGANANSAALTMAIRSMFKMFFEAVLPLLPNSQFIYRFDIYRIVFSTHFNTVDFRLHVFFFAVNKAMDFESL